jgi:hypothetical protein
MNDAMKNLRLMQRAAAEAHAPGARLTLAIQEGGVVVACTSGAALLIPAAANPHAIEQIVN